MGHNQNRDVIFFTGQPSDTSSSGHQIYFNGTDGNSVADRFTITNDVTIEEFGVWMDFISERAKILIEIRNDLSGNPGNIIGNWNLDLDSLSSGYYSVSTVEECIYLEDSQNYWLTVHAADTNTEAIWYYPSLELISDTNFYSTSNDFGLTWGTLDSINVGAASISGEEIFDTNIETNHGDVNFDESVDILDVVIVVSYILGISEFNDEQFANTDINHDLSVNILDVILMVEILMWGMPDFNYIDINPNSSNYEEQIGPSYFTGNVVAYYFGKAG